MEQKEQEEWDGYVEANKHHVCKDCHCRMIEGDKQEDEEGSSFLLNIQRLCHTISYYDYDLSNHL